jgi:carbon-monoxide dehydrogenase large subunit
MSVDGKWKIMIKTPMGPQAGTLDFATEGTTLTGKATMRDEKLDVVNGTANGNELKWEFKVKRPLPMTGHFSATVDNDKLSGKAKMGPMGEAPFEGWRVPDDE